MDLTELLHNIPPISEEASAAAWRRQNELTKPPGSLGRLETLAVQIAGMTGQPKPSLGKKVVFVMAGDHGVAAEGVSAYPSDVTAQMVLNFLRGGAAINVLARHIGARVVVVDMGVAGDLPLHPDLIVRKVAYGTANIVRGAAMTRRQAVQAILAGAELAEEEIKKGAGLLATGDMGIGNTTPSAAIAAVFTNAPLEVCVGRGTGIDDRGLQRKRAVVEQALRVNRPDPQDGLDVLSKVGGFEIAGLTGVILAAANRRVPVVVDGFISTAAAMVAVSLAPAASAYLIAAHRSQEPGHAVMLDWLKLQPVLDLDMRLGEGTGAALAMNIVDAACKILAEMATFAEAGVSNKESDSPAQ